MNAEFWVNFAFTFATFQIIKLIIINSVSILIFKQTVVQTNCINEMRTETQL